MSMRLNREAYGILVKGDIEWLKKQEHSLERDHILAILEKAVEYEYGVLEAQCPRCKKPGMADKAHRCFA